MLFWDHPENVSDSKTAILPHVHAPEPSPPRFSHIKTVGACVLLEASIGVEIFFYESLSSSSSAQVFEAPDGAIWKLRNVCTTFEYTVLESSNRSRIRWA